MSETRLHGNTSEAVSFLRRWEPNGPWLLIAIHPGSGITTAARFEAGNELRMRQWIEARQGNEGIYFHVNRARSSVVGKAAKTEIERCLAFHIDVDPSDEVRGGGEALVEERVKLLASIKELKVPPSIILSSGNGYYGLWLLKQPEAVRDVTELELINEGLIAAVGKSGCWNLDRILRVPGTINVPNKKKLELGRERALAEIVEADWSRRYEVGELKAYAELAEEKERIAQVTVAAEKIELEDLPEVDVDALPVMDWVKELIKTGRAPGREYASRSDALYAVLTELARAKVSKKIGAAIILNKNLAISAHVRDQRDWRRCARRQIARAWVAAIDPRIAEVNDKFAVINNQGKTMILKENEDYKMPDFMTFKSFSEWLAPERAGKIGLADAWLKSRLRRQYEGIVFEPGIEVPRKYNLYQELPIEPMEGDCSRFLDHLKNNVCSGNDEWFRWVSMWFAAIFQAPRERFGTCLAIRGEMGTGKTKVGEVIGSLLGEYYKLVDEPERITGKFNLHLANCLLLHADEAFWAGDKRTEGKLQNLITGNKIWIEPKGVNPFEINNYVHLMVSGDSEWLVPAALKERRFGIFTVQTHHQRDLEYFRAIDTEAANGGREALLKWLLEINIDWNVLRTIPKTEELITQKLQKLSPEQQWMLDFLSNGVIPGYMLSSPQSRKPAPIGTASTTLLYSAYLEHAKGTGTNRRAFEVQLSRIVENLFKADKVRRVYWSDENGLQSGRGWLMPTLNECRRKFQDLIGAEHAQLGWDLDEEWEGYGLDET